MKSFLEHFSPEGSSVSPLLSHVYQSLQTLISLIVEPSTTSTSNVSPVRV